ncbi:hypothetical protein FQN60_000946 [Etheostoma spectabile]|uniref:Uncharacterized protein n=1 Tax=Etheostoma spectabile TaxID=54343 RepID=A0A5J5D2K6_9PERO|nr:hypothetical protein FQN60_000946 [Etheostoma spectabile]
MKWARERERARRGTLPLMSAAYTKCSIYSFTKSHRQSSRCLTTLAVLLLAEQHRVEFLQVDLALLQLGLDLLQALLGLLSASHSLPDLHPALLHRLLLLQPQLAFI